jgi:hypothetical protein
MCGYSVLASPLRHGDVIALFAGLFVTAGGMLLLGLALERRWLKPKDMSLAFTVGDPALAIGIAIGVQIMGPNQPCGVTGPVGQFAVGALCLIFGLWQWRAEVIAKIYTQQQALSPTKIWHQLIIYPVLGIWIFITIVGGLTNASQHSLAPVLMIGSIAIWSGTCVHSIRHPRLGHPPYDWGHLRPVPPPWGDESSTLRSVDR